MVKHEYVVVIYMKLVFTINGRNMIQTHNEKKSMKINNVKGNSIVSKAMAKKTNSTVNCSNIVYADSICSFF